MLDELVAASWLAYWAPGGCFDRQPHRQQPVFDGDLVIETTRGLFLIGAYSVPDPVTVERFDLYVEKPIEVGTAASEQLYHPKRRRVSELPPELALDVFIGEVEKRCQLVTEETPTGPHVVGAIASAGATRLLWWADEELPESCAMTTNAVAIDEFLASIASRG